MLGSMAGACRMSYPRRFAVVFASGGITYLVADALAAWIAGGIA